LVPLAELLKAGPQQFLLAHASDQEASDRHYLNSWGLAFYLTFDQHLLGTPALDQYVHRLKRGGDAVEAFRELIGKPLPDFETSFHAYLLDLREDGRLANRPKENGGTRP